MGYHVEIYNVGVSIIIESGVIKDKYKMFEYYKKSAKMGFANGMYHVGEFYQKGLLVQIRKCL